jgi:hypothetical protein
MFDSPVYCAAIRNKNGQIITGRRHFDEIMVKQLEINPTWMDCNEEVDQGFVTISGQYYDRQNAYKIAMHFNQIIEARDVTKNQTLYSEMLY